MYQYKGTVARVVDADTLDVIVDLGFFITCRMRLRLKGVNAPEIRGPERPRGLAAKEFVLNKVPPGKTIVVNTYKIGKYGRYIADLFFHETSDEPEVILTQGQCLNQLLLDEGLATPIEY